MGVGVVIAVLGPSYICQKVDEEGQQEQRVPTDQEDHSDAMAF